MENDVDYDFKELDKGLIHNSEGIDLIPSNLDLASLEMSLVNVMSREGVLKSCLERFKDKYDYILIDCLPSLGMITINDLASADSVIIPVQSQYLAARGMLKLYETNHKVKRQINPKLNIEGILVILYDQRTKNSKIIKQEINILLSSPNDKLWGLLIYGTNSENYKLVDIAKQQVGNKGGEKFWRWYGFDKRVAWCAIFVSWVANEVVELNVNIPRFALVSDGVNWYKQNNRWRDNDYNPKAGDIIFFDWEKDEKVNHVGIVVSVDKDKIYTVEGNSINDQCLERHYQINEDIIYGYGIT